jgi:hypothetical protein
LHGLIEVGAMVVAFRRAVSCIESSGSEIASAPATRFFLINSRGLAYHPFPTSFNSMDDEAVRSNANSSEESRENEKQEKVTKKKSKSHEAEGDNDGEEGSDDGGEEVEEEEEEEEGKDEEKEGERRRVRRVTYYQHRNVTIYAANYDEPVAGFYQPKWPDAATHKDL